MAKIEHTYIYCTLTCEVYGVTNVGVLYHETIIQTIYTSYLKARIHCETFRSEHFIQFQGHFMNSFTLVSKFHCVCFSLIKKIVFTEKRCLLKAKYSTNFDK